MKENKKPIRKRGQRGPDKEKRSAGGGRKPKNPAQKVKSYAVQLTASQNEEIIKMYGSRTKAIKTLLLQTQNLKNMFTITATAPTVYQLNSLRSFKMKVTEHANGSFTASQDFETEQEAKEYLIKLAGDFYFEDGEEITANHIENIKKYGSLRLDAVIASIEEK